MGGFVRDLISAVAAYIAMFGVAFVLFFFLWSMLGAEGSFQPGNWTVSTAWIWSSIALGFIVSTCGGFTAALLGTGRRAVLVLAVFVVLFGLRAIVAGAPDPTPRPLTVGMLEAMTNARVPDWVLWTNPVLGVAGVWLGGWLRLRASTATTTPSE